MFINLHAKLSSMTKGWEGFAECTVHGLQACWLVPLSIIVVLIGCLANRYSLMRPGIHCSAGTFD